jgi:flavin-binding protein dodecin
MNVVIPRSDTVNDELRTLERKENNMAENVYTVIALVGTSNESWEKAAAAAIERASQSLRDLRVARIVEQDIHIEPGKPLTYRVKVELSFKYESGN